ncbi:hypothetical protein HHK36_027825 [Tetracentron sinense]|uniref:Uncharacterized protein n=1 Tax=Tetracentron sinense TaxID=13715 RepID=A0A834YIR0_TETSI|nr:hypothetical protein HHK36_027825 [Tetracentron sinense]
MKLARETTRIAIALAGLTMGMVMIPKVISQGRRLVHSVGIVWGEGVKQIRQGLERALFSVLLPAVFNPTQVILPAVLCLYPEARGSQSTRDTISGVLPRQLCWVGDQTILVRGSGEETYILEEVGGGEGSHQFGEDSNLAPSCQVPSGFAEVASGGTNESSKVQLLIYFMLKYAMEILLSESSVITTYYFSWSTSTVAIFLACLGLTVLPVNIIVGSYISNMFEDRQILLASEIIVCLGILLSFHIISPYSVPQYVCSAFITFVSAEVLEGVNLSLLSRVMSSRLSRGTYNGGLLSTEAGTLARVVADGTITLAGYLGESRLLNITLLPSLVICISSIVATCFTYNSLY